MRHAPLGLLLTTLLAALAQPAAAIQVPFTGTFTMGGNGLVPMLGSFGWQFPDTGSGTAEVTFVGAAPDTVVLPAGTFAVNQGNGFGPEQNWAEVQTLAGGGFSNLTSTPSASLPMTGSFGVQLNMMCDPMYGCDPQFPYPAGGVWVDAAKIGVPGPGFESTSAILIYPTADLYETYQWDSAPWSVGVTGNQLEAQSWGPMTCSGSGGACPGATFGASFTITLQLDAGQAGFGVGSGGASLLGGSGTTGGLDMLLDVTTGSGLLSASFQQATLADITSGFGVALPFALPGSLTSLWEITGGEDFEGTAQLTFAYDPALLPVGFDETELAIAHLENGIWELLTGSVDTDANTITVETDSFSPFSLVSVPEPAAGWLLLAALLPAARGRARRA
jgi:hypothetical protein